MRIRYENRRTLVTLSGTVRLRLKIRRCEAEGCARFRRPYRPEAEGALALPQQEFGLDVVALVGALRHRSVPEIHAILRGRGVAIAERSVTNLLDRYDEVVAVQLADPAHLRRQLAGQDRIVLANPADEPGAKVRRRCDGLPGAMQRHRDRVDGLAPALDHFAKVARSDRPGLFHAADVADLPRTNNALEQLFGSERYHERRATGRKTALPGAVLRGAVRLVAGLRTRAGVPSGRDCGRVDPIRWQALRRSLDIQRQARTQRTRFRRDPDASLNALERHAQQSTLPS